MALSLSVVAGTPATTEVFGELLWAQVFQHSETSEIFNRALTELRDNEHQQVADACAWAGVNPLWTSLGASDPC